MKRTLMLAMLALLTVNFSSCGLLRKHVTRSRVDSVRSESVQQNVSVVTNDSLHKRSVDRGTITTERTIMTTTVSERPGADITASGKVGARETLLKDSAGFRISALLDSLTGALMVRVTAPPIKDSTATTTTEKITEAKNNTNESKQGSTTEENRNKKAVTKTSSSASSSEKDTKPSFFGVLGMWIGIAVVAVAALWIIIKLLFKKLKP